MIMLVLLSRFLPELLLGLALPAITPGALAPQQQTSAPIQQIVLRSAPPPPGHSITHSFTEESYLHVDHLRSVMNDSVFERDAPDRSVKQVARRVWTDAMLAGDGGTRLQRTFVEVEASMEVTNSRDGAPRPDGKASGSSSLSGRTVEYLLSGSGGSARLLEQSDSDLAEAGSSRSTGLPAFSALDLSLLLHDCSLKGFLPPEEQAVSVGDRWPVAVDALLSAFAPGGDIATYYGAIENQIDPDIIARFGGHAVSRFGSGIDGEVTATLLGTETHDGVQVARIGVQFDVSLARDPGPWMQKQSQPFEMAMIGQTAKNARHTMTVRGEGTLRWDLTRHRYVDFEATAESQSDQRLDYAFEVRGTALAGAEHFELSGTTKLQLSADEGTR